MVGGGLSIAVAVRSFDPTLQTYKVELTPFCFSLKSRRALQDFDRLPNRSAMLRIIVWREFLANILTLRFLLGLIICTGLVSLNTWVLVRSYTHRLQDYRRAVDANTNAVRNIQVYSELSYSRNPRAEKKPPLLSIFNEGLTGRLGNSVEVSHTVVPVKATQHGSDNPYLVVFPEPT